MGLENILSFKMGKKEEFYKNLREKLEENTKFPSDYMYKFIVPTNKNQVAEVMSIFKNTKARFSQKASKTGKFVSISILIKVANVDEVIKHYHSVEGIEGLISL